MKTLFSSLFFLFVLSAFSTAQDFKITDAYVLEDLALNQLVFTIEVAGIAGDSVPTPNGALDGAPVLAYVFPTTLSPSDVGFDNSDGILALGLTSHPDFDDTPLWDENYDAVYDNDGVIWHSHWVVLEENTAVPAGLAVKAVQSNSVLPPTNPGMPMYMDSPGHPVIWEGNKISCTVPLYRMNQQKDFQYDAVTAYMEVNTSDPDRPLLGVYGVFDIASGNLSLPYAVGKHSSDTLYLNVSSSTGIGLIDPEFVKVYPNPASERLQLEMSPGFELSAFTVQLFNATGTMVYQKQIASASLSVDLADVGPAGTYVLRLIEQSSGVIMATKQLVLF